MTLIDTPVAGVDTQSFAQGAITRGDLLVGDLLGGSGLSHHGGELALVAEESPRGVWLVSLLNDLQSTAALTPLQIRARGRFFTWPGLRALKARPGESVALIRLRLAKEELMIPGTDTYFLTPSGALVTTQRGQWRRVGRDGGLEVCALPVGGELYSIAEELPR
jgi:hypothetical protein